MLTAFKDKLLATPMPVRMAVLASLLVMVNTWLSLVLAFTAAWLHLRETPDVGFGRRLKSWFAFPYVLAAVVALVSQNTPPDDLLRHLMAWRTGLDYRAQYPWSDLPAANLWLGFDWLVGQLQTTVGLPADVLLSGIPVVALLLSGVVMYGAFQRAAPKASPEAMLLFGMLALLTCAPRMVLGRPEAFVSLMGASAWLCTSRNHVRLWVAGFIAMIPFYWLGWAYAPMALVLPLSLRSRLVLAAGLGALHLAFWQVYTGDYLGLMLWLRGTLGVVAVENYELSYLFLDLPGLLFALLLSWTLALNAGKRERVVAMLPLAALVLWFALPNQVRYGASITMVALPWLLAKYQAIERVRRWQGKALVYPALLVVAALAWTGVKGVAGSQPGPTFALPANAKVLSEQPYSNVFYGETGIAVDPSFALGATFPKWKNILDIKNRKLDCARFRAAGFTHLVEHSLVEIPPCVELAAVQGEWRLWGLKK